MNLLEQFRIALDARLAALKPGEMRAIYESVGVEFADADDYKRATWSAPSDTAITELKSYELAYAA